MKLRDIFNESRSKGRSKGIKTKESIDWISHNNSGLTRSKGRSKGIKTKEAINWISHNNSGLTADDWSRSRFYRGIEYPKPTLLIVDPKSESRKSANTFNYYTLLIDNSSKWKSYPKRSKSIVCTTSGYKALQYGYVYHVIPKKGAKIAICPSDDFWFSFQPMLRELNISSMDGFNFVLIMLYRAITSAQSGVDSANLNEINLNDKILLDQNNFSKLKKQLSVLDKFKESNSLEEMIKILDGLRDPAHKILAGIITKYYKSNKTFYDYIDDLMDPNKNGFKIVKYPTNMRQYKNREVWTDSESILVDVVSDSWDDVNFLLGSSNSDE